MPGSLEAAGAAIQPTSSAPLHTNEFFTGLWTNGSPLGPGAVPYIYAKFYSAMRYDRLIDGNDVEISPRLTLIRRPGHTVYNSSLFPPINRFYEFRGFGVSDEIIRLVADCDGSTNQLTNPQFVSGATGWTLGTGWSVGLGGLPTGGIGNLGVFAGSGSAAITNQAHIPCVPGQSVTASCMGLGEPGATGNATLQITFYNVSGGAITTISAGTAIPNNYAWTPCAVTATAPAASTYAMVDFAVLGSTGGGARWFVTNFVAGYAPIAPTVREVTQPNTNLVLWTKNPAAQRTGFVAVGNTLYAGDGIDTHQWVTSSQAWLPNKLYQKGDYLIDSNNNIQVALGAQTATITKIQIVAQTQVTTVGRGVTLWLDPSTPLDIRAGGFLDLSGLTTVAALNGTHQTLTSVTSSLQVSFWNAGLFLPLTIPSPETGTVSTGSGISGATQPVWQTAKGAVTQDGGAQWANAGSAVQPWGADGPTTAPTVSQALAPNIYNQWAASTWYAPQGAFAIVDGNGNIQQVLPPGGTTASSAGPPTWATAVGAITTDGTVQWKNQGPAVWVANHAYTVGSAVRVTYSYSTITYQWTTDGHGGFIQKPVSTQVTVTSFFQVIAAGTSGPNEPAWINGIGTVTIEAGGLTWKNLGNTTGYPGSSQKISTDAQILDSNGYLQTPTNQAQSGATAPASWAKDLGASTQDNTELWVNAGPYATAATQPWQWAYSGKNSVTGDISNASPASISFSPSANYAPVIQGAGLPSPPWDTIVLWRTAAGGSQLLYDDEFPNPGVGQTWVYTDTNLDPGNVVTGGKGVLNPFITAPIDHSNDAITSAFIPSCYYLNRIWGFENNLLKWTGGPDTITGNGNSTMPPVNQFRMPSKGVLCWPTSVGLIVFTTTDIWAVLGQGTDNAPFYLINFQQGIGMVSSDAFGVNGSTAYLMLSSHQVMSLDPGAGELEVGFPIADTFDNLYDPRLTYITWHQGRSADTALYVANGSQFWFRLAAVSAPESGNVWSPAALIRAPGQVRAMISAEIVPGEKVLLLGPNVDGQPILQRDFGVNSDNTVPYPAHATIAPVVLSQPGSTAGVQFVVTEEKMIAGATACQIKMLFDEMHDFVHIHESDWRVLRNRSNDPPNLPPQKSVLAQRLWAMQDPSTVIRCRFYSQDISWPAEDFPNELWTNTVYGRLPEKARR